MEWSVIIVKRRGNISGMVTPCYRRGACSDDAEITAPISPAQSIASFFGSRLRRT